MHVRQGNRMDIKKVLEIEYRTFPKEWHVSETFVNDVYTRNSETLRILEDDGIVKGHYVFLPLEKAIYENVLQGEMDEKELAGHVVSYREPKDVYLYWITVMVEKEDPKRKQLAKTLLTDIPVHLETLRQKGIHIKEVGGIFISEDGVRTARRFGMKQTGTITYVNGETYAVYRSEGVPREGVNVAETTASTSVSLDTQ